MTRVRLATLAAVAMLLAAVGPTLAQDGGAPEPGEYEVTREDPYYHNLTVENDVYLKPGYWGSQEIDLPTLEFIYAGEGRGVDVNETDPSQSSQERKQELAWLYLHDPRDAKESAAYEVTVETNGPVVAAMDVFKVWGGNQDRFITPNCPQKLVDDLYPEEDENRVGYGFRILHQTVDYRQRTAAGASMSVDLFPRQSPQGFLVAVYPQVASGNDRVNQATGGSTDIDITVSIDQDDLLVDNRLNDQPPAPYHTSQWVGSVDAAEQCADSGVPLPDSLTSQPLHELPGEGPVEETLAQLFAQHIE